MLDSYMTLTDFRQRLGLSKATTTRLFAKGEGPARTRIGKRVLLSCTAVQSWIDAHTEGSAQAAAG
jgi:predicted DNA-binding transcriptional regulator AlpA